MHRNRTTPPFVPVPEYSKPINGVQVQGDLHTGETAIVRPARVWAVEPDRGDLFLVHFSPTNNQFVQLGDGGIVDNTWDVRNREMRVKCDLDGNVIALPVEGLINVWNTCVPMQTPRYPTKGRTMFTVFGVYRNADQTEGRGPMVLSKLFASREVAEHYVVAQPDPYGRQREWRDGRYGDWELRDHAVFQSLEEIEECVADEAKRRALAKLTDEDKRALGL